MSGAVFCRHDHSYGSLRARIIRSRAPGDGAAEAGDLIAASDGFDHRLRDVRVQAGLSQNELARLTLIPKSRLSRYENAHLVPSMNSLGKLAKALGVTPNTLMGHSRDRYGEELMSELSRRGIRIRSSEQALAIAEIAAGEIERTGKQSSR